MCQPTLWFLPPPPPSVIEASDHHLPPGREQQGRSPWPCRTHRSPPERGTDRPAAAQRGAQPMGARRQRWTPSAPSLVAGNGRCCRIRQAPCTTVWRKELPKGPQLSTGHGARAPGPGKTPPASVEGWALSPTSPQHHQL